MSERHAKLVSYALGGEAWHSGGGIWLVRIRRPDGRIVVISEDMVCEYTSEYAMGDGLEYDSIMLK